MAVLKCTICGGDLVIVPDSSIGVCQYCGSTITIPKELDRKGNLYNRAVFLRQNNEFDKAVLNYEEILREDNFDAEAHWGLVLSKYGIEYVADPKTGEYLPTCHRTQAESILTDPDYIAALEYSDAEARSIIVEAAKKINTIQARILEISRKEPPYDIFICYKESAEDGSRTQDSIYAQDLYYQLQKSNYRVFFARKTLESKLGAEYEPIIYAALNSAKVMVVLGTKPEHFQAVWVRNEWSRFLKMANGADKVIIPAYRDFSPYELPAELANFQSQDMNKIGFMQDLTDGIERCLRKNKKPQPERGAVTYINDSEPREKLVKNGNVYLKLDNYTAAQDVFEKLTKNYPDEYMGWWGMVLCKTKNLTIVPEDSKTLTTWFKYAKQLADDKNAVEIEEKYVSYCRKIAENNTVKEYDAVNENIKKQKDYIKSLEANIKTISESIANRDQSYNYQEKLDKESVQAHRKTLENSQKLLLKKQVTLLVWLTALFISVLSLIAFINTENDVVMIFFLIFLVVFIVSKALSPKGSMKKYKQAIAYAESNLENVAAYLQNNKNVYQSDINSYRHSVIEVQETIEYTKAKIAACERYLSLGRDKICQYCYAEECAVFGVEKQYDPYVKECRDYAYGKKEVKLDAEQNAQQKAPANSQKPTGKTYEVGCAACGKNFFIDENTMNQGQCHCEYCGAQIKFR